MTIGEVLGRYAEDVGPTVKGKATLANCIVALASYWGDMTCGTVTSSSCKAYEKFRAIPRKDATGRLRTAGTATVRRELGVLQSALRHGHRERILLYPVEVTLSQEGIPRERWLTRSEAARLIRAAAPHARRFILLSLYTGRRMATVLDLTWTRVDLDAGVIRFRADGEHETKKRRGAVKVPRQLLAHLKRWRRLDHAKLTHVITFDGERLKSIRTAFDRACERAGLDDKVTRHTLKHTAITWAMMNGISIEAAAEYFHTKPETIRKFYWQHSPHHQAEGLAAMERRK